MAATNIIKAVDAALALSTLLLRVNEQLVQLNQQILDAENEGRDLTDAEIAAIQANRKAAVDRLKSL